MTQSKGERERLSRLAGIVREIRTGKGLSLRDVYKRGGPAPSWVSALEHASPEFEPKPVTLQKLADALKVPYGDLASIYWGGEHGLQNVNSLSQASGTRSSGGIFDVIPITGYRSIPVYGSAACGNPRLIDETPMTTLSLPDFMANDADFATIVRGDSMQAAGLIDGAYILIKRLDGQKPKPGSEVLASIDGDCTVKFYREDRLGKYLESAPASGEPERWPVTRETRIIGTVVGVYSKRG